MAKWLAINAAFGVLLAFLPQRGTESDVLQYFCQLPGMRDIYNGVCLRWVFIQHFIPSL